MLPTDMRNLEMNSACVIMSVSRMVNLKSSLIADEQFDGACRSGTYRIEDITGQYPISIYYENRKHRNL